MSSDQGDLFVYASSTSRQAAESIRPSADSLRGRVLDFLRARGTNGATDEEMQLAIPMPASTQRPRRVELVQAGLVVDVGEVRKTKSGRDAVVWHAKQ